MNLCIGDLVMVRPDLEYVGSRFALYVKQMNLLAGKIVTIKEVRSISVKIEEDPYKLYWDPEMLICLPQEELPTEEIDFLYG